MYSPGPQSCCDTVPGHECKEKEAKVMRYLINKFITEDLGFKKEDWEDMEIEKIFAGKRKLFSDVFCVYSNNSRHSKY